MTIAEVDVKLQIALPQGWTKDQIFERLADILQPLEDDNVVVEFGYEVTKVNSDPFNDRDPVAKLPSTLEELTRAKNPAPGVLIPWSNSWGR